MLTLSMTMTSPTHLKPSKNNIKEVVAEDNGYSISTK